MRRLVLVGATAALLVLPPLPSLTAAQSPRAPARPAAVTEACPRQDEAKYLGSKSCQKCHFKEFASWQKTKMAQAFATLKPGQAAEAKRKSKLDPDKDYTREAKCVACHVTGYGKAGGYPAIEDGKEWTAEQKERAALMEGVGCETCHGPGETYSPYKKDNKDYRWDDIARLGAFHPVEKTCTACHNKESPGFSEFDYAKAIGRDTHEILKMKKDHGCDHKHH